MALMKMPCAVGSGSGDKSFFCIVGAYASYSGIQCLSNDQTLIATHAIETGSYTLLRAFKGKMSFYAMGRGTPYTNPSLVVNGTTYTPATFVENADITEYDVDLPSGATITLNTGSSQYWEGGVALFVEA